MVHLARTVLFSGSGFFVRLPNKKLKKKNVQHIINHSVTYFVMNDFFEILNVQPTSDVSGCMAGFHELCEIGEGRFVGQDFSEGF